MRFTNQIAVIFGAGRGIGKAIATRLSSEGAKLVIIDILNEEIEQLNQRISESGGVIAVSYTHLTLPTNREV